MKKLYRTLPIFILLWTIWSWQTLAPAQVPDPAPSVVHTPPLFDPGLMDFAKVFGLGGMIFIVWLFDYRRQRSLESIVEQYDKTQQAHLAAFKDINERNMSVFKEAMNAIIKVADDAKGTAILCATVNTQVAAKLEILIRERPQ